MYITDWNHTRYEMRTSPMSDDMDEGIYLNVMPMTPPGSAVTVTELFTKTSPTPSPNKTGCSNLTTEKSTPLLPSFPTDPDFWCFYLTEEEKRTLISEVIRSLLSYHLQNRRKNLKKYDDEKSKTKYQHRRVEGRRGRSTWTWRNGGYWPREH